MTHLRWQVLSAILAGPLLSAASAAEAQLVINEIDYDQDGTDSSEFVELFNSSENVCVDNVCVAEGNDFGVCGDPATFIHDLQGSGESSPIVGQHVVIEGVVVGDFQDDPINGLFVQEEDVDADGHAMTSEGVFVFEGALNVPTKTGDVVRVQGDVAEFDSLTELNNVSHLVVCPQNGNATSTPLTLPVGAVSDFERLEGMLVHFTQTLTVTENFNLARFGSLSLSSNGRLFQPTQLAQPGAAALALRDLNNRSRIELDDMSTRQNPDPIPYKDADNTRRIGDTVVDLRGVLSGRFGAYRIQPTSEVDFISSNPRPPVPPVTGGKIKVASFNVLNFFTTLDVDSATCGPNKLECRGADSAEEFERQYQKLLNALQTLDADVVGLNEIENNASAATRAVVNGLNARLGAGTYDVINTGTIGTDAIKVALIYKPAVVSPVGAHAVLDSSVDPRFIDDKSRPVLAQTFAQIGNNERLTVAVLHLKSKGSACDDVGDPDTGDLSGNCNRTRTLAVQALVDWLATDPTHSGDHDFLVIGDFNAYRKEDPIEAMKAAGYEALIDAFIGSAEASSYVFSGESGYLDHAFSSPSLSPQISGVAEWHHNADEPRVLDYNVEFKTDDPFNIEDPFRASDHDSLIVGLDLSRRAQKGRGRDRRPGRRPKKRRPGPQTRR